MGNFKLISLCMALHVLLLFCWYSTIPKTVIPTAIVSTTNRPISRSFKMNDIRARIRQLEEEDRVGRDDSFLRRNIRQRQITKLKKQLEYLNQVEECEAYLRFDDYMAKVY